MLEREKDLSTLWPCLVSSGCLRHFVLFELSCSNQTVVFLVWWWSGVQFSASQDCCGSLLAFDVGAPCNGVFL